MTVCSSSVTLKRIHAVSLALAVFFCTRYKNPSERHQSACPGCRSAAESDQCQVDGVAQPGWCHLPDRLQAFHGMAFSLLLLDTVDGARCGVVRTQALRRGMIENVHQQSATLIGAPWGQRNRPPNRTHKSGQSQLRANSGGAGQALRPGAVAGSQRPSPLPSPYR